MFVNWTGRFCNKFHFSRKLLHGILNDTHPIDAGYEDRVGQPPTMRSMEEIPNVCAITKYYIQWRLDRAGGTTIMDPNPDNWRRVEPKVVAIFQGFC